MELCMNRLLDRDVHFRNNKKFHEFPRMKTGLQYLFYMRLYMPVALLQWTLCGKHCYICDCQSCLSRIQKKNILHQEPRLNDSTHYLVLIYNLNSRVTNGDDFASCQVINMFIIHYRFGRNWRDCCCLNLCRCVQGTVIVIIFTRATRLTMIHTWTWLKINFYSIG